jgi:hypothetical protein
MIRVIAATPTYGSIPVQVFDRHYGRLFEIYDRQNHAYQLGGVVAPLLPMRALSMGPSIPCPPESR